MAPLGSSQASAIYQVPTTAFPISINRKSLLAGVWVKILGVILDSSPTPHLPHQLHPLCAAPDSFPHSGLSLHHLSCLDHCSRLLTSSCLHAHTALPLRSLGCSVNLLLPQGLHVHCSLCWNALPQGTSPDWLPYFLCRLREAALHKITTLPFPSPLSLLASRPLFILRTIFHYLMHHILYIFC